MTKKADKSESSVEKRAKIYLKESKKLGCFNELLHIFLKDHMNICSGLSMAYVLLIAGHKIANCVFEDESQGKLADFFAEAASAGYKIYREGIENDGN